MCFSITSCAGVRFLGLLGSRLKVTFFSFHCSYFQCLELKSKLKIKIVLAGNLADNLKTELKFTLMILD